MKQGIFEALDGEGCRFHHVGIAVDSIDRTLYELGKLIAKSTVSKIIHDEQLNVDLCLITYADGGALELVQGESVSAFLTRRSPIYHICFECKSIEYFSDSYKGFCVPITKRVKAKLFNYRNVQFFNTPLGIVEVLE